MCNRIYVGGVILLITSCSNTQREKGKHTNIKKRNRKTSRSKIMTITGAIHLLSPQTQYES